MSAVRESSQPLLRPMLYEDVAVVLAIENQVYSHGWTEGIFRDCLRVLYSCWVLEQQDRIIGYGIMSVAVGEAHILNIAVDPGCQSQGLGRGMLMYLLQTGRHHGAETAFLEVRSSNRIALRLYESSGFHQVGLRRDYYPAKKGREDAVIMARDLGDLEP
ncbi:MAG: ribosomal protein S18-alanine N-acetyltransferase [Gammaproteobacteria bacterium]|nr:ribosomal protein S18-alanine N-acetyltransferase [Gammaproteobacteria bacterium]